MQRRFHIGLSFVHPNVYNKQGTEKSNARESTIPQQSPQPQPFHSDLGGYARALLRNLNLPYFSRANEELKAK